MATKKKIPVMRKQPTLPARKGTQKSFVCRGLTVPEILLKVQESGGDIKTAKVSTSYYKDDLYCEFQLPESDESYNKRLIAYEAELAEYRLWVQLELPSILLAQQTDAATQLEKLEQAASKARATLNQC